jgi:hypothetical protein
MKVDVIFIVVLSLSVPSRRPSGLTFQHGCGRQFGWQGHDPRLEPKSYPRFFWSGAKTVRVGLRDFRSDCLGYSRLALSASEQVFQSNLVMSRGGAAHSRGAFFVPASAGLHA